MPSEVDVCNDALGQIGQGPITALDDGTTTANYCTRFYPTLRDGALQDHHWNFALKRQALAEDATAPVSGYAHQYTLPGDCLKVIELNGSPSIAWDVEQGKLQTDETTATILYLSRITDPTKWSPLFYQGMTCAMAWKLAGAILHDFKLAEAKRIEAYGKPAAGVTGFFNEAKAVDGQEGSVKVLASTALTTDVR